MVIKILAFSMICQMDLVINHIPFGVLLSAIQNLNET